MQDQCNKDTVEPMLKSIMRSIKNEIETLAEQSHEMRRLFGEIGSCPERPQDPIKQETEQHTPNDLFEALRARLKDLGGIVLRNNDTISHAQSLIG